MKKSIAFVITSLETGGAERVVSTMANLLSKNYKVTIITFYKCIPFYHLNEAVEITFCNHSYNPNPTFFQSIANNFYLVNQIRKKLIQAKADIAIGFLPVSNIYTILASRLVRIPCIISERENLEYRTINNFWHSIRKFIYRFASSLIVQTEANKNRFSNYIKHIEVINNPLSIDFTEQQNLHPEKENIIINVGRLIPSKKQDLLIRAFAKINNLNWKLYLIGDGPSKSFYEEIVKSLNMENQIIFTGNIENISTYYRKAKIFAFTSEHEGFPNALIEAMSFGMACISTDCPDGPSEIITHGENGFLIPINNQIELEKTLNLLMYDETLRRSFENKTKESTHYFHPEEISKKWIKIIEKLTSNET